MRYLLYLCMWLCLCPSFYAFAEDVPIIAEPSDKNEVFGSVTTIATSILENARLGRDEFVRASISLQYLNSGKMLQKILQANGRDTSHFEKNILKDFDFYSIVLVKKIIIYREIAFLEASVIYSPEYIIKRHKETDGKHFEASLWNSVGGNMFADDWEKEGRGTGTFYFVRQNNVWKLHGVYHSWMGLTKNDWANAESLMKSIVGPNTL